MAGITRKSMVEHPKAKTKAKLRRVDDGELVSFSVPGAPQEAGFQAFRKFLASQTEEINGKAKETDLVKPSEAVAMHHSVAGELDENGMVPISRTISRPFSGQELSDAYGEYADSTVTEQPTEQPAVTEQPIKGKSKGKPSRLASPEPLPEPSGNGTLAANV